MTPGYSSAVKTITISQLAEWCDGKLLQGRPADVCASVSTDSRTLGEGSVFVALKGERYDGHDFIKTAAERRAGVLVASQLTAETVRFPGAIVHVRDTLVALQMLAWRYRQFRKDVFVVGVTGSSGKTSTKDLLAAVLSRRHRVNATKGNLNNHIGLPLTVLATEWADTCGVWEMGMNHPGEIEVLAEIAAPDAAVITNIGVAHLEHMGSREAIALEKGMLVESIRPDGVVVLPAADDFASSLRARSQASVLTVGINDGEVRAENLRQGGSGMLFDLVSEHGRVSVELPLLGEHMVVNALLASAIALNQGISGEEIAAGLSSVQIAGGRLQRKMAGGLALIDDTYNANPDSMRAALATLSTLECHGRRIALLGRMAELGEHAESAHRDIGRAAAAAGISLVLTVGAEAALIAEAAASAGTESLSFADHEEAAAWLKAEASRDDVILLKGSRSAAMEKIIEALG